MNVLTLGRNPISVNTVVKPSLVLVLYETMKELIMESSHVNGRNVENSSGPVILEYTK